MENRIRFIDNIHEPELIPYARLTEAQLRNSLHPEDGLFIAESPKVIKVAIEHGYSPLSLVCEEKHIYGDAKFILDAFPELPVYSGSRDTLSALTGYTLTRGVLCAMRRPALPSVGDVCKDVRRVVVIHGVCDTTNIGSIFRSAAALGIDGILLTPDSCDPLNRRSIRVSMGTVFSIPWTWLTGGEEEIRQLGFKTVAMALTDKSISINDPLLRNEPQLAIIMGTEGEGLPTDVIMAADYTVRIPMAHGVDSLNVGAAAAIACWELTKK